MRRSSRFLLAAVLTFANGVCAQQPVAEAPVEVEVINLTGSEINGLYFQTVENDYEPLKIVSDRRGSANAVRPGPSFQLFRKRTLPDGETAMDPVFEMPLPTGLRRAILFFYWDGQQKLRQKLVPDSSEIHPGGNARLINLMEQPVVCLVGEHQVNLAGNAEAIRGNLQDERNRFRFAFAMLEPKPYRSPVTTLLMRFSGQRFTAVFSYQKAEIASIDGTVKSLLVPNVSRLYDVVPDASDERLN